MSECAKLILPSPLIILSLPSLLRLTRMKILFSKQTAPFKTADSHSPAPHSAL